MANLRALISALCGSQLANSIRTPTRPQKMPSPSATLFTLPPLIRAADSTILLAASNRNFVRVSVPSVRLLDNRSSWASIMV
jgi:hypothetical protein